MALELKDLMRLHDRGYQSGQVNRERASDDLVFYWVTQWDDNILAESQLAFRGEFNILRKAGRQIISDLASNPVQVDFEPKDETRDDAADLIDGLYRSDDNSNLSQEAYDNAKMEAVVCGVGAWLLYTGYASIRNDSKNQVIMRKPIFEANNTCFWDPNSKLLDKSDADFVSVLTPYSQDGYKDLVKELTGEEITVKDQMYASGYGGSGPSFKHPEHSYTFPWIGGEGQKIYVSSFYHREKVKEKVLVMVDPFGETMELWESSLNSVMDEMIDAGYSIQSEKRTERWKIKKYIASGADILSETVVVGEHIPVVPAYGERAYVEGEEHYEGCTRLAKDPQRLRNFQLSYLADIVSRSPRQKPIFWQEQIAKFEDMYSLSGSENNFPYLLMNRYDGTGVEMPVGPVAVMPEQKVPDALLTSIDLSRQAVEDVANPGVPQDIADPDISGKAALVLQARLDMQSMVYQEHHKYAKRRDAEIYASMASETFDVPRRVKLTLPDGTRTDETIMQSVVDKETGDIVVLNDLRNAEFDVFSKIGPSYSSQKEQTVDRLGEMIAGMDPADPARKVLQLKQLALMDGVDFDDVRDYVNKQLIVLGVKEPETDEEIKMLEEHNKQGEEPDAAMVLAQGEMMKGQAALLKEKREGIDMQLTAENEEMKRRIDAFEAQTDRLDTQIDAQKAGADISHKRTDEFGKKIENTAKIIQLKKAEIDMTDDELFGQIMAG